MIHHFDKESSCRDQLYKKSHHQIQYLLIPMLSVLADYMLSVLADYVRSVLVLLISMLSVLADFYAFCTC